MARFHLDQNVAADIGDALRDAGHDVVTTNEAGLLDADDDEHLLSAAKAGRIVVTHNGKDFRLLHGAWLRWARDWGAARTHAGILIIPQSPFWTFPLAARTIHEFVDSLPSGQLLTNELHEYARQPAPGRVSLPIF